MVVENNRSVGFFTTASQEEPSVPLVVTADAAIGRRRILTKDTSSFTPCWNEKALLNGLCGRVPQSFKKQISIRVP